MSYLRLATNARIENECLIRSSFVHSWLKKYFYRLIQAILEQGNRSRLYVLINSQYNPLSHQKNCFLVL